MSPALSPQPWICWQISVQNSPTQSRIGPKRRHQPQDRPRPSTQSVSCGLHRSWKILTWITGDDQLFTLNFQPCYTILYIPAPPQDRYQNPQGVVDIPVVRAFCPRWCRVIDELRPQRIAAIVRQPYPQTEEDESRNIEQEVYRSGWRMRTLYGQHLQPEHGTGFSTLR
jgi:hypothetical protein